MRRLPLKLAVVILVTGSSLSFGAGRLVIHVKPPQTRIEVRTSRPGPHHVWVSGRWVRRPTPRSVWVPGHWNKRYGGCVWVPGHWK